MHLNVSESPSGRSAIVDDVREHYDTLSPLYRTFWGEHIHHGYWRADESAAEAQLNLVHELATRARVSMGESVLDVGCGLGGSSLHLARTYGSKVRGISISPRQIELARAEASRRSLDSRVSFEVRDAHRLAEDPETYDVIWVIECSEHLFDKPSFIAECANHLNAGGRLAICAWLRAEELNSTQASTVDAVRTGMLCPSFGSLSEYSRWMTDAGLTVVCADDVTSKCSERGHSAGRCSSTRSSKRCLPSAARSSALLRIRSKPLTKLIVAERCGMGCSWRKSLGPHLRPGGTTDEGASG